VVRTPFFASLTPPNIRNSRLPSPSEPRLWLSKKNTAAYEDVYCDSWFGNEVHTAYEAFIEREQLRRELAREQIRQRRRGEAVLARVVVRRVAMSVLGSHDVHDAAHATKNIVDDTPR